MRWLALVSFFAFVAIAACGSNPPERLVRFDAGGDEAGSDASVDGGPTDDAPTDDSPYLGGPCVDDAQCDDHLPCTYDSCDQAVKRCKNVPDDTQCQDGIYCDGQESCVPGHGCEPGPVVTCSNGDACSIARCVEASKSCSYTPRDVDQDGDPDSHCTPGHDCNDLDPRVSSLHAEVCVNGVDDNCNGVIDEQPCVAPLGDTCANAVAAAGAGTYALSTLGANDTFATSCSVPQPLQAQNVVAAVTLPPGPNVDLEVWVTGFTLVAVAIQGTCGQPSSELACGSGATGTSVRARARNVPPGTYYAVVTTQAPSSVELKVVLLTPTPKATNVDCATAAPLQPGTATTVSIIDPPSNLATVCPAPTGELTYSFTLAQPQDVRVLASTLQGSGTPILGLRAPPCTTGADELTCASVTTIPLYERGLPPGTYVVTVGATAPMDVGVDVQLSPPTTAPPDQTCAAPPAVTPNGRITFDLSNHENAIKDGCYPSGPDAAFDLMLAAASDVLAVERLPQNESGAVSFDAPACDMASRLSCTQGGTPNRTAKRNMAAGDYRVVVADDFGEQGTLDVFVRPTVAPTIVASGDAGTCAQAVAVDPVQGGFFTGDTSTVSAGFTSGCDSPSAGDENAQLLSLALPVAQRVILDMEGSGHQTLLDVREGSTCPGSPVASACYVGFGPQSSFLDLELAPGQYWILASGYNKAKGPWDLDVRILPP